MFGKRKKMTGVTASAVSLLLAALFLFAACSDVQGNADETTETAAVSQVSAETTASLYDEDGYLLDKLPEKLDLGGIEVHTLYDNLVQMPDFFVECENFILYRFDTLKLTVGISVGTEDSFK